ncbi:AI-2E family transporter [Candidatus Nanohalovita haloferacivicina]|uniref:AI-2E family transporter n=1 Tax=Candidatus Nanohalovita haloferacivicina TaxID=2978046 RepID=UPI00325FDCC9|nr:Putative permease [Candidatus Nanohalobia archaeon BNXNv]
MNRKKAFLFLAMGVTGVLIFLMISPYLGYLLTGGILAFMLHPAKRFFDNYTKYSAAAVIMMTFLMAVFPLVLTAGAVANDASDMVSTLETADLSLDVIDNRITQLTGQDVQLEERLKSSIQTIGSTVLSSTSEIVDTASNFLIGISLLLFLQYYLLKEGEELVEWSKNLDLMPTELQNDLYQKTADTTRTVIKGHVITAAVSGLVAGVGLYIAGISNVFFWTFMMMILGLIPLVGTALVWVPAAAYLLLNGNIYPGLFLLAYGAAIVGSVDNFLRPFLVDESADLHPLFIILGVIGGIGVFGPIGVFVGPVLFGLGKSLVTIYIQHYEEFQ